MGKGFTRKVKEPVVKGARPTLSGLPDSAQNLKMASDRLQMSVAEAFGGLYR